MIPLRQSYVAMIALSFLCKRTGLNMMSWKSISVNQELLLGCFGGEYGPWIGIAVVDVIAVGPCEGSWPKQGVLDGFYGSSKLGSGTATLAFLILAGRCWCSTIVTVVLLCSNSNYLIVVFRNCIFVVCTNSGRVYQNYLPYPASFWTGFVVVGYNSNTSIG